MKVKNLVAIFAGCILLISGKAVFAVESCIKCHKSMDKVAEYVQKSKVKSADEFVDFLKNKSAKKALHRNIKDEDIKLAFIESKKIEKKNEKKSKNMKNNRTEEKADEKKVEKRKKIEGC